MKRTVVAVVLTLLGSTVGWASLILNGGFESGDFTAWTVGGACPAGGSGSGPCWTTVESATPFGLYAGSYSGKFGAQPDPVTMVQPVTLPAGPYTVSFQLALTTGTPKGTGGFTPANYLDVSWGGSSVGYLSDLDAATWSPFRFLINSSGAATDLMFTMRQDTTGDFYLDEISIDPVPEPATLWLMGLGLTGLGLLRRKKA